MYRNTNELYHYGVIGMKWGVRRYQNPDGTLTSAGKNKNKYRGTGISSAIAARKNKKIDESFKRWEEGKKQKETAINKGKNLNSVRQGLYDGTKTKSDYKVAKKEYSKALNKNTTHRKGGVKEEVLKDESRKHLSNAKKAETLYNKTGDKSYKKAAAKEYSIYNKTRAKARTAQSKAANRSRLKASYKAAMTKTTKSIVGTAAVVGGVAVVNKYMKNRSFTLNGKPMYMNSSTVMDAVNAGNEILKAGKKILRYV